ncbi:MAG: 3-deoxy-manno-octulosonate cytidylyltransferase [Candidatus Hydrogenedentes bacterium]|nr:3-deoxy-manno-octulosonate cytidylyltransferase [Candidatus Hydrogenedentota bacterium]
MKVGGVIPARFGSTRLQGKALLPILGKPMIQRVYERCQQARVLDLICVAADDERIVTAVKAFGGNAIMTRRGHASGTDRVAEAVETLQFDIVVNIQGDQPFIDPIMIEEAVQPMLDDPSLPMATLMHPLTDPADLADIGIVKVVCDVQGNALYFSRSPIPYAREEVPHTVYEHVGLYVYRREFLLKLSQLLPTPLEQIESLEQLRVLENGFRIRVVESKCRDHHFCGFSVDTPEDLAKAEAFLRERGMS